MCSICSLVITLRSLIAGGGFFLLNLFRRQASLAAENLFLRKQLAFFVERDIRPRRASRATRLLMVFASRLFDWRQSLVLVKPDTFIRWHHDRDGIYSQDLDHHIRNLSFRVLKTPIGAPQANSFCERLVGSMRRECLDFFIPLGESSLRRLLQEWKHYYNKARVHSRLGPGLPEPTPPLPERPSQHRHRLPEGCRVSATPVLGGLHHDYRLDKRAA